MEHYLDGFIDELLHINEGGENKLIDLEAGDSGKTYYLSHRLRAQDLYRYVFETVSARLGKVGNTILRDSSLSCEQVRGRNVNDFDWRAGDGQKDVKKLDKFIDTCYKEINFKGNNPLFLSVGALRWKIAISNKEVKDVLSPLLIFPIRLIRSVDTSPVCLEFVDDDIYFNPCLAAKLKQVLGEETVNAFPHPNGIGQLDEPINLQSLGDGEEYFAAVADYIASCKNADINDDTVFEFDKNTVAIAQYNHAEMCTYYDVKRNREQINNHPLVQKMFAQGEAEPLPEGKIEPQFVLPYDSVQQDLIRRVVNGESLIIKGPPGTGKTQTIANMIATLLGENKRVLLSSKKLSALAEVYAKLPDELRKFTLLLEYETEAQAAKVNPTQLKGNFKKLMKEKREYAGANEARRALLAANTERSEAITFLADYVQKTFADKLGAMDVTYYQALDTFLKNEDLPNLTYGSAVLDVTAEQYYTMFSRMKELDGLYQTLTANGKHSIKKCPWFGQHKEFDTVGALQEYQSIAKICTALYEGAQALLPESKAFFDALPLREVYQAACSSLTEAQIDTLLCLNDGKKIQNLQKAMQAWQDAKQDAVLPINDITKASALLVEFGDCAVDRNLTWEQFQNIYTYRNLFYPNGKFLAETENNSLSALANRYQELASERATHISNARCVFTEQTLQQQKRDLQKAIAVFEKYTDESKPRIFDFKAKKTFGLLAQQSYLTDVSFQNVVGAVKEYAKALACDGEEEKLNNAVNIAFRRSVTKEERDSVLTLYANAAITNAAPADYLQALERAYPALNGLKALAQADEKITIEQLIASARACVAKAALVAALTQCDLSGEDAEHTAQSALALYDLFAYEPFVGRTAKQNKATALALQKASDDWKQKMVVYIIKLNMFDDKYFRNYYTAFDGVTFGDLQIFANEAEDREILSAALRYFAIEWDKTNALPLAIITYFFEKGTLEKQAPFQQYFEHGFYGTLIDCAMRDMQLMRNGLGKRVDESIKRFADAEQRILQANAKIIEEKCMARIDPDAREFAFLEAERDPSQTLRSLFKKYAKAILNLKKCIILSPSTASVLFRPEEYNHFDVVIVDEASQLEPVNLLPVLFRSKQCVIVGDEWQMPPIKHFVAQYEKQIVSPDGTEVTVLEPEISVLTLALRNQSFRAEALRCHYRSKTESLITFSQKLFYPQMRTFPAALPMQQGLGFTDILVPEGKSCAGVNEAEAKAVVKCIKTHFERYFDEEKGVLKQSFGVVAFGEAQTEYIQKLVEKDRELSAKVRRALEHFNDVPEKLIFYKTIETVQGQETAHLILSLTYGRTEKGTLTSNFGQLNRDKLGRCIFNVAVTRAQSSITVVHSVTASEITGENVSYIADYLRVVERYSKGGKEQFVSKPAESGFLQSVADYIVSCGIDEKRVVFHYGVTDGSVRMPIAVLSENLDRALLGVWCEVPVGKTYDCLDYMVRYPQNLKNCGWKLHTVYAHDWVDNAQAEREKLAEQLKKLK